MPLPSLLVSGTVEPAPLVEVDMSKIALAFNRSKSGQWSLRDRMLNGVAVPSGSSKCVAEYVHEHFSPLGDQWVNPSVILRLVRLQGERIKIITMQPSRGIVFHGGYTATQLEALVRKGGLFRATATTYFSLNRVTTLNARTVKAPYVWMEDGPIIKVARNQIDVILAAADASGWLTHKHDDRTRTNPEQVIEHWKGLVCYRAGQSHSMGSLTPESQAVVAKLPWLKVSAQRKINLSEMRRFEYPEEGGKKAPGYVYFDQVCGVKIPPELIPEVWSWVKKNFVTVSPKRA